MPKSMLKNDKVRLEINRLLEMFKDPETLNIVAKSMFRRSIDIPSDNWSPLNRIIQFSHGTIDARGMKAWKVAGRNVKKGGSFCIVAPSIMQVPEKDKNGNIILDENGKEKKKPILVGFYPIPVWPAEQTDGKDIDYKVDKEMPKFIGIEVAKRWGISIKQGFDNPSWYGYYSPTRKEITVATDSQITFTHELMHAADEKVQGKIKPGQEPQQEIVAEFGAAVLLRMLGLKKIGTRNVYDYVKQYANQLGKDPIDAVVPLIGRMSKAIELIVKENQKLLKE
jgi:antirestriction protein ArdC